MTTSIQTKLVPVSELETTCSIVNAMDLCEALNFTTSNDYKRALSLLYIEFGECGFERKSDWMRFINKLNKYDDTPIKRMVTGDKKSLDWGGAIISREDIEYSEDGFLVEFKEPTPLIIEQIGENYLVVEVTKIKGQITWEWYHSTVESHKELGNYAGICEVFLHSIEIVE